MSEILDSKVIDHAHAIRLALQAELQQLDVAGFSIAALHVSAAIDSLDQELAE